MIRKVLVSVAALGALTVAVPASATWYGGCKKNCGSTSTSSSTSGATSTSSSSSSKGSSSSGNTSSSGNSSSKGSTSSSSGTKVPEPGMLGLAGAGLAGLGMIQLRRRRKTA